MAGSQKFEKFSAIFLLAGLLSLLTAFFVLAFTPARMLEKVGAKQGLPTQVPENFQTYYKSVDEYQKALLHGRDIYISEACWHCHSQYVRPVSNESLRYGPVATAGEYQNILNLPQLFGTRRVGPDLSREAGKRTNDWHFIHLFNPKWVEPQSIMPGYTWYFDVKPKKSEEGSSTSQGKIASLDLDNLENIEIVPRQEAIDLVAYLQWLGSAFASSSGDHYDTNAIVMPPAQ